MTEYDVLPRSGAVPQRELPPAAPGHAEHGDRTTALANEILRTVVGSGVHGIAIAGTDDHDEMGVFVEPPEHALGLSAARRREHFVYRTQPEGARSGPGDTDLVVHALRKYRLEGRGTRHGVPNRPELVERYGYDVKYASHALRLAYQGREIARDGRLTLPMPAIERERVLAVKGGEVADVEQVLAEIRVVRAEVEVLLGEGRTPLPERADAAAVNDWSVGAHRRHWGWTCS